MAEVETTVEELLGVIECGALGLPEMQRRYACHSTRCSRDELLHQALALDIAQGLAA